MADGRGGGVSNDVLAERISHLEKKVDSHHETQSRDMKDLKGDVRCLMDIGAERRLSRVERWMQHIGFTVAGAIITAVLYAVGLGGQ